MYKYVSVIVPVYNVAPYLKDCIRSILNQTYKYFEVILVDDGSTDDCGKICDEYVKMDDRVKVFHKENGGLSSARNFGIIKSTYDYLSFIDSDDIISQYFLEFLMQPFNDDNSVNLTVCKYKTNLLEIQKPVLESSYLSEKELLKAIYTNSIQNLSFVTWNKIYSRKLFEKYKFPEGHIHEDEYTTYKLIYEAQTCSFIDVPLYFYRIRENSIMTGTKNRTMDCLRPLREAVHYFDSVKENILFNYALNNYLSHYRKDIANIYPIKDRKNEKRAYRALLKKFLFKSNLSLKKKIFYFLYVR